jgi:catechol 2,3-dioxygenase-like lactoylglutathione lyase family enzyme
MIQVNGLNHIVLHVQDVARAKRFYMELLGMTVYRENDAQAFLHCGHQGVALFKKQGDAPLTTGNDLNHLAFDVESGTYEALKAELEQHGVKVSGAFISMTLMGIVCSSWCTSRENTSRGGNGLWVSTLSA